jgi:hypothetical protein
MNGSAKKNSIFKIKIVPGSFHNTNLNILK